MRSAAAERFPALSPVTPGHRAGVVGGQRRHDRWAIGLLAAGLVAATGTAVDLARRPAVPPPTVVLLAPVTRGVVVGTVRVQGSIESASSVSLTQPVAGRLIRVTASAGDRVKRGQVLAAFDPLPLRVDFAQADARLVAAEAAAYEAEVKLSQIVERLEATRRDRYPEPGEDPDTDDLRAMADIAQARTASALAEVSAREAAYRLEHRRLRNSLVRAPADGLIVRREVADGQVVPAGAPLFTFSPEGAKLQAEVTVSEERLAKVEVGQDVELTVPALPGRLFAGRVLRVLPLVGRGGGARLPVVIQLDQPGDVRAGMSVAAAIRTPSAAGVLRIPTAALFFSPRNMTATAEDPAVWVTGDGGLALTRVPVEVGALDGSFAEVRGDPLHEAARVAIGYATTR